MRTRKYLLSVLGTTAVVAIGAGAAGAATGSKTAPVKPATPRTHGAQRFAPQRFAPRTGNCPGMGSAKGSASGTSAPAVQNYGSI